MNILPDCLKDNDATRDYLITKELSDQLAKIMYKALHNKINNPKLEVENIQNSRYFRMLSQEGKDKVLDMCDKAQKYIKGAAQLHALNDDE